jgi:hypothetical protein
MAERFKINYFIRGLDPLIAGRTYEGNPNTLDDAITRARAIETGNNFLLQSLGQNNLGIGMSGKQENSKPKDEIDELTKQLENLKIAKLEKEIKSLKGEVYGANKRPSQGNRTQFDIRKVKCYTCGKMGHTSRFCKEINNKRMNVYDYEEYSEEEQEYYYLENESEEDDYQMYYQDTEFYPAERNLRSRARMNPTEGTKVNKNKDEIVIPRQEDIEMTEKPKRVYVPKGKGKFVRRPSRFQQNAEKYDIVEDMKQMKPNINLAQLVELNPSLGVELAKATKRERVLRNQQ